MKRRSWNDLTPGQKCLIVVGGCLEFGLLAAALWDLSKRSPEEVRGSRRMWAVLVFIEWIGPIAYFTIGRKKGLGLSCSCCKSPQPESEV